MPRFTSRYGGIDPTATLPASVLEAWRLEYHQSLVTFGPVVSQLVAELDRVWQVSEP